MESVSNTPSPARNTPGPWAWGAHPSEDIAQVYAPEQPATSRTIADVYEIADARLIAAAPDLLRELIRLCNRCPGRMPDPRYGAWHDGCCTEARALILRVQGKAK